MSKRIINLALIVFAIGLFVSPAKATHIMGGDLTYRYLGDSTYELTFLVYRDCDQTASIDNSITYWVYYKSNKAVFLNNRTVDLTSEGAQTVSPEAPNCVTPSGICIESGKYIDTVSLGNDPDGYIVTWYRHERNHAIDNLARCQSTSNNTACNTGSCPNVRNPFGMVWTAEVPPYKLKNTSPQFLTVPVPYFCTGLTNSFNHVVYDPDGDSLAFKIVTPLSPEQCIQAAPRPSSTSAAPAYSTVYKNVVYQSGYSSTKPFGSSSSAISINATTGEMKANPTSAGNYVIAIKIEEYRVDPVTKKSTYLGSIRRDLQFIAGSCPSSTNTPPFFNKAGSATITVNPGDTIEFDIEAEDNSDSVFIVSNGNIFGGLGSSLNPPYASFPDAKGLKKASSTFKWVPTCDHITYTSPHVFTITISDDGCNTVQRTYSIYVQGRTIYTPPDVTCLDVLNDSTIKVSWDSLENVQYFNGLYLYRAGPGNERKIIKTFTDSNTVSYEDKTALNADVSEYRYYLKIENSCGLQGFPSDSMSTVVLTSTEINDKTLRFDWNASAGASTKYYLQKKISGTFTTIDSTTRLFADHSSCDLLTDFRIMARDTVTRTCPIFSNIFTSTTKDNTPPVGAPGLLKASVVDYSTTTIDFTKSTSGEASQYKVLRRFNGNSYATVATIKSSSATINHVDNSGLSNADRHYCYKIVVQDSCGNDGDTSATHCLVNLKTFSGQRESKLKWNNYSGFTVDSQFVERWDSVSKSWKSVAALGANASSYIDNNNVLCGFNYSYRIKTVEKGGATSISYSDSQSVRAKDTIKPDDVDVLYSTHVNDTTTQIVFKKSLSTDVNNYFILTLEYLNGTLDNTYIYTHPVNNQDTFKIDMKTPSTGTKSYCFGVLAVDSCGQNFSNNRELHCPVFLSGTPQNLSTKLDWTFNEGFSVDSYFVQVKDPNGIWKNYQKLGRSTVKYTDDPRGCNDSIEYRIKTKERNTSLYTYSNPIKIAAFDTIKPASPNVRYATVENDTTLKLEWDHSSSSDVDKYNIWLKMGNGTFTNLSTEARSTGSTQVYFHQGVNAKTDTFAYRIIAEDSCASTNLSVNNRPHHAMQLTGEGANLQNNIYWSHYSGFDVKEYQVETYDKTSSTWSVLTTLNKADSKYVHQNVYCFDTITYRIKALDDNSSEFAFSDTIRLKPFDTISPEPPVIQSVSVTGTDEVSISWKRSTSADANLYIIYRKNSLGGTYKPLDTLLNKFKYVDKVNTSDSVWIYGLKAIDSCVQNVSFKYSAPVSNVVAQYDEKGCSKEILLSWNAYNNFESGLSGYQIWRSVDGNAEKLIGNVGSTVLNFSDDKVNQHHTYDYRILAVESAPGTNTAYSQRLAALPFQTPVPEMYTVSTTESDAVNGEVKLYWKKQAGQSHIKFSKIYYKNSSSGAFTSIADSIGLGDSTFTHTGINTKTNTHQYFIVNVDSCRTVSDTLSIHKTMDMDFGYGQLVHNLQWTDYEGVNVKSYILQQFIGSTWTDIDTIDAANNTFDRFPAPCNTVITYRIAAVNPYDHQAYSDTTSGVAIDLLAPDAPEINNVSVVDNKYVLVEFTGVDSLDTYAFSVDRSKNGKSYLTNELILYTGQKQKSSHKDSSKLDSNYLAYKIVALDSCLNATPSSVFKSINLLGYGGNFENHLAWRPFQGYSLSNYFIDMDDNGTWVQVASLSGTDTSFTHTGQGCNAPITYRIRANENGGSRITISNWITLTPFDTIAPSKPVFYTASVINEDAVELKWDYQPTSDVKFYHIYKELSPGSFSVIDTVERTDEYVDSIKNGGDSIYQYIIQAVDSCNALHISPSSDTISTFLLKYTKDTCNPITYLNWTTPRGFAGNLDMYFIQRQTDGKTWKTIDTVAGGVNTYADSSVQVGSRYVYRVGGHNSLVNVTGNTDTIDLKQSVRNTPYAPLILSTSVFKTGTTSGEVDLVWNSIPASIEPYLKGYRLWWNDTLNSNWKVIADLPSRLDTTYKHVTNTDEERGYYRITAYNTCLIDGDSSFLNSPILLDVVNLNLQSDLSWTEYFGGSVQEYRIYSDVGSSGFKLIGTTPANKFKYKDTTVGCGESIDFRVEAVLGNGLFAQSNIRNVVGFDTTLPEPTTIKRVSVNATDDISIEWNESSSKDARFYTVAYKLFSDNQWDTLIDNHLGLDFTASGLTITEKDPYQFRITVTDSCGNKQIVPSPVHHHIALGATTKNNVVELQWMNYRGWAVDEFNVYKDNNIIETIQVDKARNDSIFIYLDSSLDCETTLYDYRVEATGATGFIASSNTDEEAAVDKTRPASVYLKSTSVLPRNEGVRLEWQNSRDKDAKYYHLMRKAPGDDSFSLVKKSQKTGLDIDSTNLDNPVEYCYRIAVEDECGNISELSNDGCIMVLTGGNLRRANSLKWNEYRQWKDSIVQYEVYRSTDSSNWEYLHTVDDRIRTYVDSSLNDTFMTYCYRVKAVEKKGGFNEASWSTILCVTQEPLIYIPTAFTPEFSQGINDHFGPQGAFIPDDYTMRIYNRWGERIFETSEGEKWDGTVLDGEYVPLGVYVYYIQLVTTNGEVYELKGNVKVFR